jgi:hypothetical protein
VSPDFDDLIGDGVEPSERERLRRAHEALLVAGPPSELPAGLARPRGPARRQRPVLLLAAAVAVAAAFFGGWLAGGAGGEDADFSLAMEGTAPARAATATLDVFPIDEAGNWPMKMRISGLPDGRYELVLTRAGSPVVSCGFFLVHGPTEATLNAPYKLKTYDGWAVVRPGSNRVLLRTDEI